MLKTAKILIIQTAFIGDVVLSTPIIEALRVHLPEAKIDMLIRKGNEALLLNHPILNKLWIWDKKTNKFGNQFKLIRAIRKQNYEVVINLQRFMSSGLFTFFSGAKITIGFDKNPLSFTFTHRVAHIISKGVHETDRNLSLLSPLRIKANAAMKLYPSKSDYAKTFELKKKEYIVIAPSSVWFTKQYPEEKWITFLDSLPQEYIIYGIGGPDDRSKMDKIINNTTNKNCINLCGDLSLLESAALMQDAKMNYVNDSAPMHFASSVNASVTAIFCSTIPDFGFGPRSEKSFVVESLAELTCRPCGLHGKKECPEGHFNCANNIDKEQLLSTIRNV